MAKAKESAEEKETQDGTDATVAAQPAAEVALIDQIGTLTYPRAVAHFGKENALAAMREVARIGGHGEFDDEQFTSPLFGGLAMPDPAKIPGPSKEDFAALPEADFHFQAAVEKWEAKKQKAIANRQRIGEYYSSLKQG